jgi:hypothetical protein
MFARKSLEPAVLQTLALVADTIARGVERKWAENKLQESERNLRLFMETIPQMLWSAAPDGAIIIITSAFSTTQAIDGRTTGHGLD